VDAGKTVDELAEGALRKAPMIALGRICWPMAVNAVMPPVTRQKTFRTWSESGDVNSAAGD